MHWPGLSNGDEMVANRPIRRIRVISALRCILLHFLVIDLCAVRHHSRPHRRMRTIPGVVDIYILHFPRSATQMQCPNSRLRSRVSSSELDMISHVQALRIDVKTLLGHPVLTLTPKGVKYVLTPAEITVRTY